MNKRFLVFLGVGLVAAAALVFLAFIGSTSRTPKPPPPPGAANVHFEEHTAWETWDYLYRFDAPPQVCMRFAVALMKQQSHKGEDCVIKTNLFTSFPVRFPQPRPWFDVSTVTNGLLLTADDWFYAVVDQGRGRLYYYNGD